MDENLHDIDMLFKNSIEGHEEMPGEKVWDAIDNNLDKSNVVQIKKKYNNLKRIAIALLLLLLGTVVYEIQTKKMGKSELVKIKTDGNNNNSSNTNENTEKNNGIKKLNETVSGQSSSANNTETSNAANDDSNTSTPDSVYDKNKKTVNYFEQSTKALPDNNLKKGNADKAVENVQPEVNNKSLTKKSSKHQTKITVKNAIAEEDVTNEKTNLSAAAVNESNTSAANELMPLENMKTEKMVTASSQNNLQNINTNRLSPDAVVKNKNIKTPKPFHFSVTPFFSPQFSFNRIENNDRHGGGPQPPQQQPPNGREEIKRDEQHQTSFSLGVLFDLPLGKNWEIQSGITYLNKNISIEPKKIFAKLDNDGKVKYRFDCSSGYTYILPKTGTAPAVGDSVNASSSANTLQYLGIPLAINYNFSIGKFNIIPSIGSTANFLVKQRIETELLQGSTKEKQTINTIQGLKSTYFTAFTGIAVEYNLNKKFAFSIKPAGNFALSSITKDAAVKSYPNSFGVAAGVKIKF